MGFTDFREKNKCCGCGACVNICPKAAMELQKDKYGFFYPVKNEEKCINCGLCEKVCNFNRERIKSSESKSAYAVVSKDSNQAKLSSSGGFFAKLAEYIINCGGIVCGAAWSFDKAGVSVRHIIIDDIEGIKRLQGSKYVQSQIGNCYKEVQAFLKEGRKVLFSGTPCQVDGLKGFLGRDYENLLTVDIVCHGVHNENILNSYLKYSWPNQNVTDLSFRDKRMGWGMTGFVEINKKRMVFISPKNSSYFYAFINGLFYRDNCYNCPYTGESRPADITIGDFWGVMEEHAQFVNEVDDAISAVILNSEKGKSYFEHVKGLLNFCQSDFDKIAKHNSQLRAPSTCPNNRGEILEKYASIGYKAVDDSFCLSNGKSGIMKENVKLFLKVLKKGILLG